MNRAVVAPLNHGKKRSVSFQKPLRPSDLARAKSIRDDDDDDVDKSDDSHLRHLKTWREKLADLKKDLRYYFITSWTGMLYKHAIIGLSLVSLVIFIIETYQERIFIGLQRGMAAVFIWDWSLSLFLANVPAQFLWSPNSILDLFSIIPIYFLSDRIPFFGEGDKEPSHVFYLFMYGFSITRVLRALRVINIENNIRDPVTKCLLEYSTQFLIIMLFNAGLMDFIEQEQDLPYHTWMYFIWVTTATVGYGDINPHSTVGRFMTMAIIGFSVLYVPTVTSKVLDIMQIESKYARMSYVSGGSSCNHIVICGDLDSISLREFFDELFHEDHNNSDKGGNMLHIVVMQPNPPTAEMATLLMDPVYSLRLTFIEGSALNDKSLERCSIHTAVSVFVMANKFSTRADEEDAKTVLQLLSVRRFNERKHDLVTQLLGEQATVMKYYVQIIKSENRRLVPANNLKNKSVIICMNDIKMGLVAKATVYPGTNTFILNLITSIANRSALGSSKEQDKKWERELNRRALLLGHRASIYSVAAAPGQMSSAANLNADLEHNNSLNRNANSKHSDDEWITEYACGCNWEVYCVTMSQVFEGSKFVDVSFIVAQRTNILVIGLHVTDLSCGLSKVLLNPATFVIPTGDKFEVSAIVVAENKQNALKLSHLSDQDTVFYANAFRHSKVEARRATNNQNNQRLKNLSRPHVKQQISNLLFAADSEMSVNTEQIGDRTSLLNMNDIAESMDKVPENFVMLERNALKQRTHILDTPRLLQDCMLDRGASIIDHIPDLLHHIIIMGKDLSNVYDLIRPLRARYLGPTPTPIVILHPNDISDAIWTRISHFPEIYVVKGSSLHEMDILRAGIFRAQQVVVLADACAHEMASLSTSATTVSQIEALVDSDALFTYQCVKRLVPHVHIVVEMFQQQNISYLELSHLNLPFQDFRFSKPFAAGCLFTTSMLDSLVCGTFYNPVHMKIVEKLINGVDAIDRDGLLVDAITDEMHKLGRERQDVLDIKNSILNNVQESCLYLVEVPEVCHNKSYRTLFENLAKTNIIPLGLLRVNRSSSANDANSTGANPSTDIISQAISADNEDVCKPLFMPNPEQPNAAVSSDVYVYTNPSRNTVVSPLDKVFVLSTVPVAPINKTVTKLRAPSRDTMYNSGRSSTVRVNSPFGENFPNSSRSSTAGHGHSLDLKLLESLLDNKFSQFSHHLEQHIEEMVQKRVAQVLSGEGKSKAKLQMSPTSLSSFSSERINQNSTNPPNTISTNNTIIAVAEDFMSESKGDEEDEIEVDAGPESTSRDREQSPTAASEVIVTNTHNSPTISLINSSRMSPTMMARGAGSSNGAARPNQQVTSSPPSVSQSQAGTTTVPHPVMTNPGRPNSFIPSLTAGKVAPAPSTAPAATAPMQLQGLLAERIRSGAGQTNSYIDFEHMELPHKKQINPSTTTVGQSNFNK